MFGALFGFDGRIGRGGWWFAQFIGLMIIVMWAVIAVLMGAVIGDPQKVDESSLGGVAVVLLIASVIVVYVINICSTVKRYHDRGKSGWWFFISVVPFIGGIWQLIECGFCSGDDGDNHYGPPPGSAKSFANLEREISTMSGGKLAKVDDDYIAKYAQNFANSQVQQQPVSAGAHSQNVAFRPTFGKR
jgi:uncharacterized membrane protein YhaH (DUF805 family)